MYIPLSARAVLALDQTVIHRSDQLLGVMGLGKDCRFLEKKRTKVKDKFHLKKKDDVAFLRARNDRCVLAARLLPGAFVFLDSPQLGTTKALTDAGIDPVRMFPVNGCNKSDFCKKAKEMGAYPTVSMFDAAPPLLKEKGVKKVRLCYNDGTHGDPDLVWADMYPWLERLAQQAYISFTFALRSHNAIPLTGKFGLLIMLAQHGFEPPGGWQFLTSAFTFDGRIFNVHMTRGVASQACGRIGLCQDNSYSLGARYKNAEGSKAEKIEDVRGVVMRFLKKCPHKPFPMSTKTPHVSEWEALRRRICRLGVRGEKFVLDDINPKAWLVSDYLHWVSNKKAPLAWHFALRYPKRLVSSETRHWTMVGTWVSAGLKLLDEVSVLVVADMHPKATKKHREWLAGVLPTAVLWKTLCVGDPLVTSGVKASTTRGSSCPARVQESLLDLICNKHERNILFRFGMTYSLMFLTLFSSKSYEEVKKKTTEAMVVASERSILVLSLRSPSPLTTVAWAVWIVSDLAKSFSYKMAGFCEMRQDGGDLVDYSRIVTMVLSRGAGL